MTPEIAAFRRYGPELRRYGHHYVREPRVSESEGQLDLQRQLKQALSEISPMHAAVLLLHRRDGLSQEAIAVELQLDAAVVAKYLAEARAQIRMKIWK